MATNHTAAEYRAMSTEELQELAVATERSADHLASLRKWGPADNADRELALITRILRERAGEIAPADIPEGPYAEAREVVAAFDMRVASGDELTAIEYRAAEALRALIALEPAASDEIAPGGRIADGAAPRRVSLKQIARAAHRKGYVAAMGDIVDRTVTDSPSPSAELLALIGAAELEGKDLQLVVDSYVGGYLERVSA